jgi:hypothetical protein
VYDGKGKLHTKRERTVSKGYAASFNELEQFIDLQTPAEEIIEHGLRPEVRMYPTIAIRELVANALIHQDFSVGGASVQPINRTGDVILARPMTEPTRGFELNFGEGFGNGITR